MKTDQSFRDQPTFFDGADYGKQSRDAQYQSIVNELTEREKMWLARIIAAGANGVTLDELSQRHQLPPNQFSGRITSLKAKKLVRHTADRRATRSGGKASVIVACQFLGDTKEAAS